MVIGAPLLHVPSISCACCHPLSGDKEHSMDLNGKVIAVTGGAQGLGLCMAQAFAAHSS